MFLFENSQSAISLLHILLLFLPEARKSRRPTITHPHLSHLSHPWEACHALVHVCTNGKCVCANRDTGDLTTNKEKGPHHQYQTTSKGDRITPPTSPTSLITSHAAKPRPQRKTTSSRHTLLLSLSRAPAPSHISVVSTCPPYPLGVWQSHLSRGTCYVYREHNIYI